MRVDFASLLTTGDPVNDGMTQNQVVAGVGPPGVQAGGFQQEMHGAADRMDAALPNLKVLSKNNTVADSVNQLLALYKQKGRQEVIQVKGSLIKEIRKI